MRVSGPLLGSRATRSATRTFSRPGCSLAIDGPSGPDLRAIYGTAACSALHRAPADALALFGTPGNFRLKRRGVGSEKWGNSQRFARHAPFRSANRLLLR